MDRESVRFKVLVVGDTRVGKTSFLKTYTGEKFSAEYQRTFGVDFYTSHEVTDDRFDIDIHFWDLSGYLQKDQLATYFRDAHGAIVIFDERPETKAAIVKWKEYLNEKVTLLGVKYVPPVILVHNKVDKVCTNSDEYNREALDAMTKQLEFRAGFPCCTACKWNIRPIIKKLVKEMVIEMRKNHDPSTFQENEELWTFLEGKREEENNSKCLIQ
jgi:small GTP-binding protein